MNSNNTNRFIAISLASILLIVLALIFGCDSDSGGSEATSPLSQTLIDVKPDPELSIEVISVSDCKTFENLSEGDIPQNQTALQWEYDGDGNLTVRHINTALNAGCPEFPFAVYLLERELTIFERQAGYCFGVCLVDVEYRVTGLPNGKFHLKIDEFLHCPGDPLLETDVLLKGFGSSGQIVHERSCFPWVEVEPPEGTLIFHTGCGYADATASDGTAPSDSNCIIYEYGHDGVLYLEHQNAVFNCCIASMIIEFTFSNDTIYIREDETYGEMGPCACICPYTVYMQVVNLLPGEYTIVLTDRNRCTFDVDLHPGTSGYYCFAEAIWW